MAYENIAGVIVPFPVGLTDFVVVGEVVEPHALRRSP